MGQKLAPAQARMKRLSSVLISASMLTRIWAADRTWTGAGSGNFWSDPANWGGSAPINNDALFFAASARVSNTNNLPATSSYSGLSFNVNAGAFILNGASIILAGGVTNSSAQLQTVNFDLQTGNLVVSVNEGGPLTLNGGIKSATGALTKAGPGLLSLNGLSTYPGPTTILEGTLNLRDADRLGSAGGALVLDGGTLETGNLVTLNNRAVLLNAGAGTFNVDQLSTLKITNGVSGSGALIKLGAGTLDVVGPISSAGPIAVEGGALLADGSVSGPSSLTVYSGGLLGGGGSISTDVFVTDGGTLGPGANDSRGAATLTLSNLALSANSIVRVDLNMPGVTGGTNDLIVVHGNLTLNGILKVTGKGGSGVYPIIRYDGNLVDNGMALAASVTGALILDTTNKVISLNAVAFPSSPPLSMRVFFVGNSLTYTYDVPGTVQGLANAAGDWFSYGSHLVGGATLADHDSDAGVRSLIDSGNYDLVMLQEYSSRPTIPSDRDNLMFPAARDLNNHIVSHGERTIFYETWGYPYGDSAHCSIYDTPWQFRWCTSAGMAIAVRMGYARIANELNAAISPVGLAWMTVQSQRPDINLYYNTVGDYHPSAAGSYLAACVHYASIFGRSPAGNSFRGSVGDANTCAYLQSVAEKTVFSDPWAYDQYGFASNRFYWASRWIDFTNRSYSRLNGVVISGSGGLPSPSVKLDTNAGQTNNVYLGVYGYNYELAGQGRLYVRAGGSLVVTGAMIVGKEGRGWVQQDGGSLQVSGPLTIAEQPLSSGSYNLAGGFLLASTIQRGQGSASFTASGGQLSFGQFGAPASRLNLAQSGGTLTPSQNARMFGNLTLGGMANLSLTLSNSSIPPLVISGTAALGGNLSVSLPQGLTPASGQQFALLSADAVSGRFNRAMLAGVGVPTFVPVVSLTSTSALVTMIDAHADVNTNGLPDWWEYQYFGSLNSGQTWTNSLARDGIANGYKYALCLDPTLPVACDKLPQPGLSNGYFMISFRQRTGGFGSIGINYARDNMTYSVQTADNPASGPWVSGTNAVEWTGDRWDNGDGSETVSVRAKQSTSAARQKFLRLIISR